MTQGECEFRSKKIGIIGGCGAMGKWFEKFFSSNGLSVIVSDRSTQLTNIELVKKSDLIILSTPMDVADNVLYEISPYLSKDKILMDIFSLKKDILDKMLAHTKHCEVVGCHPMFGQHTKDLRKQNIIFCKGRGGESCIDFFTSLFESHGAVITLIDPEKHDKYMAIVQGLTHLFTIATGEFMKELDVDIWDIMKFATPVFRLNMGLVGRLFELDLGLYKNLVGMNSETGFLADVFINSFNKSLEVLTHKTSDKEKMEFLEGIKKYMGDYSKEALNETNEVFNFLYDL